MCRNLDGMVEYKEEAISQGEGDCCQTIQMLQVPISIQNTARIKQAAIENEKAKSTIQNQKEIGSIQN